MISLPTPTSTISSIGAWSKPFFSEFLGYAYFVIGAYWPVLLVVGLVMLVIKLPALIARFGHQNKIISGIDDVLTGITELREGKFNEFKEHPIASYFQGKGIWDKWHK